MSHASCACMILYRVCQDFENRSKNPGTPDNDTKPFGLWGPLIHREFNFIILMTSATIKLQKSQYSCTQGQNKDLILMFFFLIGNIYLHYIYTIALI